MSKELCYGSSIEAGHHPKFEEKVREKYPERTSGIEWYGFGFERHPKLGIKRPKLKCSLCGRKVTASVKVDDGEVYLVMPPHKPKGWHKSKKS